MKQGNLSKPICKAVSISKEKYQGVLWPSEKQDLSLIDVLNLDFERAVLKLMTVNLNELKRC